MKEIGGYFELELRNGESYYPNAVALNSARNCLRYLVRAHNIQKIWIPAYTCPVVWEALEDEGCKYEFYEINEHFLPKHQMDADAYILYNNYFGVCDKQVEYMVATYPKIIIDNSQAFYSQKKEINCFCSPRKFFGVPDGGYVYSIRYYDSVFSRDTSTPRISHLLKRIEIGANAGYNSFKRNDASLDHADILLMSELTKKLLHNIEYEQSAIRRRENFLYLHEQLSAKNELKIELHESMVPMIYPYLPKETGLNLKRDLIERKIFVATYWPGQKDKDFGLKLQNDLIALPIDQRYGIDEMTYILEVLNE